MTGKNSSSCPIIFYWKEITLCKGCSAVFNGLIALVKAASHNAVTEGNYHLKMLLATRESHRISLMLGAAGEELCRMSDTFCSPYRSMSRSLSVCLPPHHHHQSSITQREISQPRGLENKLIFTPSLHTPEDITGAFASNRLQAGSICVADLSFAFMQPARHRGSRRGRCRRPNLTKQSRNICRSKHVYVSLS